MTHRTEAILYESWLGGNVSVTQMVTDTLPPSQDSEVQSRAVSVQRRGSDCWPGSVNSLKMMSVLLSLIVLETRKMLGP